jgi:hypothetical protein
MHPLPPHGSQDRLTLVSRVRQDAPRTHQRGEAVR